MIEAAKRSRLDLGDVRITYIPDGHAWIEPKALAPGGALDWAPYAAYLNADNRFAVSIGAFLVQLRGRTVLVDLGLGKVDFSIPDFASFRAGSLLENLAAEGVLPEDVDTVFFTHLHHDHVGWTTDQAPASYLHYGDEQPRLTFPNARYLVTAHEWEHWKGTDDIVGPSKRLVQEPLADRVSFLNEGDGVAPGVTIMQTPGHTAGHASLLIESADERVIVLGDIMHCQVQIERPDWTFMFDQDQAKSRETRERILRELEKPHTGLAAGHFSGSVFGRVDKGVARRMWVSEMEDRRPVTVDA